jgi:hypothetical protein
MNHRMKSVLQALSRVKNFAGRPDIPANARVARLASDIGSLIATMEQAAANQVAGAANRNHGTKRKLQLAEDILEVMRAINRTAKSLDADTHPSVGAAFRMPTSQAYQALLSSARAFLEHAAPIKEALVESALPADFDEKLQTLIADFAAAMQKAERGYGHQVGATEMLLVGVRQGSAFIRKLDAVMKNLLRGNDTLLGIWKSASHIERPPRRGGITPGSSEPAPETTTSLPLILPPTPPATIATAAVSQAAAPVAKISSADREKKPLPPMPRIFPELFANSSKEVLVSSERAPSNQECGPAIGSDELTFEPLKTPAPHPDPTVGSNQPELFSSQPAASDMPVPANPEKLAPRTKPSQGTLFPDWE